MLELFKDNILLYYFILLEFKGESMGNEHITKSLGLSDIFKLIEIYLISKDTIKILIQKAINNILTSQHSYKINVMEHQSAFEKSLEKDFQIIITFLQEYEDEKNYFDDRDILSGFKREYCHVYKFLSQFAMSKDIQLDDIAKEKLKEIFISFTKEHDCKDLN